MGPHDLVALLVAVLVRAAPGAERIRFAIAQVDVDVALALAKGAGTGLAILLLAVLADLAGRGGAVGAGDRATGQCSQQ